MIILNVTINNFKKSKELVERFRNEFGGITCEELQQQFTGRTYDMWNAEGYKANANWRAPQCVSRHKKKRVSC